MNKNNKMKVNINVDLNIDYQTAKTCLSIVELYLNQNDTECLVVENNEPGGWNLVIKNWRDFNDECE